MANYESRGRTNYFRVRNQRKFREWCKRYEFELITQGKGRDKLFGFIVDEERGLPSSYFDEASGEDVECDPLDEMADHLAPGHVGIYIEIGNEKMTYINGFAWAVNSKGDTASVNLFEIMERAKPLGKFITECQR
jgi:hypothetical protein